MLTSRQVVSVYGLVCKEPGSHFSMDDSQFMYRISLTRASSHEISRVVWIFSHGRFSQNEPM